MKNFIVVNNPQNCRISLPETEVVSAKNYLASAHFSIQRNARVFNLCRSYRYQSVGYYVSLLAQARGHRPLPSVQTIQDLKTPTMTRLAGAEFDDLIQQSLSHIQSDKFTLSIYFGHNLAKCHDRLSMRLFQYFQAPFLQASFVLTHNKWQLQNIAPMPLTDVPEDHIEFVEQMAGEYLRRGINQKKRANSKFDLAILYNPKDISPPSNERAIARFIKAAEHVGFDPEIIGKDDYSNIAEFDALFIRETTAVNHHTYRFARRAEAEGLYVIDDPESILKCSNKVYLAELLERYKIRTPKTLIVHADNVDSVGAQLGFPCVIKQPDGAFSNGVIKVETEAELFAIMPELLEKSDLLIAQEFVRTPFDWRVCVFQGQPIFACKYYMARKHWQIYERLENGKTLSGKSETFPVSAAPKKVVRTALRSANLIGNGLYGVDIKEVNGECFVIEINDNQSIDSGVEDLVLQDDLYMRIMSGLLSSVERGKNAT
jgi:glutathione synthase/RimK-type ligase-like ATP-grasp enzyme